MRLLVPRVPHGRLWPSGQQLVKYNTVASNWYHGFLGSDRFLVSSYVCVMLSALALVTAISAAFDPASLDLPDRQQAYGAFERVGSSAVSPAERAISLGLVAVLRGWKVER